MIVKVTLSDEEIIHDIGHAFGYYDYGAEHGLADAFPDREAVAAFIGGYVRMASQSGMLYTTGERVTSPTSFRGKRSAHARRFRWQKPFSAL